MQTKPARDLEFVNLGASPKLDDESKERVRSHAMLQFNRNKSEQDSACTPPERDADPSGSRVNAAPACSRGRFRLAGTRARPNKKHPDQRHSQIKRSSSEPCLTQNSLSQLYCPYRAPTAQWLTEFRSPLGYNNAGSSTTLARLESSQHARLPIDCVSPRTVDPFNSLPISFSKRGEFLIDNRKLFTVNHLP
jgi:hypothetical protein